MSTRLRRHYVSSADVDRLREHVSGRDLAIVQQVSELRLMSAAQIGAVHFTLNGHDNPAAASRAAQRVLARLVRDHLLARLERRVGGVRAGSAGYIYALGSVGQRLLNPSDGRRRSHEPRAGFLDHTLAASQLVVDVTRASRSGRFELLTLQSEPRCHRTFAAAGGSALLKPDLFVSLGVGDMEHRWFIEVDRGNESLTVVIQKCGTYDAYYQSGKEQAAHGVFPRVCWIVPDKARADQIISKIRRNQRLLDQMFEAAVSSDVVEILGGGAA
jgi:Replication-relaxation